MAIGSATSTAAATNSASVTLQDFLKILTTELQYQDPLQPASNTEFVAQIAQFTSLQQTQDMDSKISNLLTIQSATQGIGLIGKTVQISAADGSNPVGKVTALTFSNGNAQLSIQEAGGQLLTGITLSQITTVQ